MRGFSGAEEGFKAGGGTEPEAIFSALNHGAGRTDLGLPDSSRRLDIDDDRRLQVNKVVVGVGKEGMPFVSAGPLCGLTPTEPPRARRNRYRPT